jgi:4-hydroxybenzoate polyprenyltransferase
LNAKHLQKRDSVYLKIVALLSAVRWKNVLFMASAQYIAFLFAFNTLEGLLTSLAEVKVHLIIASTSFMLAAGYIINNFYDLEKDLVNRPHRTRFQNLVSRGFKLNFYLLLNLIGLSIALAASWRIFIFFFVYGSLLWFYSHKLSKIILIREFTASFLTVLPFFSLVIYFRMMSLPFFLYGMSLFFLLFAREIHKDIIWMKGDLLHGYKSIATRMGLDRTKRLFQVVIISSYIVDAAFLWIHTKPEFFYVLGSIAILKTMLLILVERRISLMHRLIQLAILLFIIGIVWL